MSPLLSLRDVSCHFGPVKAVDGLSLDVNPGEVLGLVGESGSGKSTVGKLITGLYRRTSGLIEYDGEPLPQRYRSADFRRYAARIQMVFQDAYSAMNPRMTVLDSLIEPLRVQNREGGRELAMDWLDRIGLPPRFANCFPHELSGGQRQRVGIARAFITAPKLVICDEPVSALDVSVQAQIVNLLRSLQAETGVTMIFIAHDLAVVAQLADRMAVMYHGRIVEEGSGDLFEQPLHPYTQALVAANPGMDTEFVADSAALRPPSESGCAYASRCPRATAVCRAREPELREKVSGWRAACHHVE